MSVKGTLETSELERAIAEPASIYARNSNIGVALVTIGTLAGLAAVGLGLLGFFKKAPLSNFSQTNSIALMAGGGGAGLLCIVASKILMNSLVVPMHMRLQAMKNKRPDADELGCIDIGTGGVSGNNFLWKDGQTITGKKHKDVKPKKDVQAAPRFTRDIAGIKNMIVDMRAEAARRAEEGVRGVEGAEVAGAEIDAAGQRAADNLLIVISATAGFRNNPADKAFREEIEQVVRESNGTVVLQTITQDEEADFADLSLGAICGPAAAYTALVNGGKGSFQATRALCNTQGDQERGADYYTAMLKKLNPEEPLVPGERVPDEKNGDRKDSVSVGGFDSFKRGDKPAPMTYARAIGIVQEQAEDDLEVLFKLSKHELQVVRGVDTLGLAGLFAVGLEKIYDTEVARLKEAATGKDAESREAVDAADMAEFAKRWNMGLENLPIVQVRRLIDESLAKSIPAATKALQEARTAAAELQERPLSNPSRDSAVTALAQEKAQKAIDEAIGKPIALILARALINKWVEKYGTNFTVRNFKNEDPDRGDVKPVAQHGIAEYFFTLPATVPTA